MGFDQGDSQPIVNPSKKTTKVNLFLVLAVVAFFGIGAYFIWSTARNKPQSREEILQGKPAGSP